MNATDYHNDATGYPPSLSASIAKLLINRSPRHAWLAHPRLNPKYRPEESSRFDLGSAAHALLIEGQDRMAVIEAEDWRTKAAQQARDAARAQGKFPVLGYQYIVVHEMTRICKQAVADNPDLAGYTLDGPDGISEHTYVWHDGATYMRARLDRVSNDRRLIMDYKTCDNAEPEAFLRQILNLGYDLQGAFYLRANERPDTRYILVAQEIEPPYAVSFIGLTPAMIALGNRKVERAIAVWRECMESGEWAGYPKRVCYLDPPDWAMTKEEAHELSV
jgi:hypothetical protein